MGAPEHMSSRRPAPRGTSPRKGPSRGRKYKFTGRAMVRISGSANSPRGGRLGIYSPPCPVAEFGDRVGSRPRGVEHSAYRRSGVKARRARNERMRIFRGCRCGAPSDSVLHANNFDDLRTNENIDARHERFRGFLALSAGDGAMRSPCLAGNGGGNNRGRQPSLRDHDMRRRSDSRPIPRLRGRRDAMEALPARLPFGNRPRRCFQCLSRGRELTGSAAGRPDARRVACVPMVFLMSRNPHILRSTASNTNYQAVHE
jgi:hypothetical protein